MKPPKAIEKFLECEDAYVNPRCPYVAQINIHSDGITEIKTNVEWLKKGYWIQTLFGVATLIGVAAVIFWLVTGNKLPL